MSYPLRVWASKSWLEPKMIVLQPKFSQKYQNRQTKTALAAKHAKLFRTQAELGKVYYFLLHFQDYA